MTKPIEISAEEVKRAGGDVGAAVRIKEASEAKRKVLPCVPIFADSADDGCCRYCGIGVERGEVRQCPSRQKPQLSGKTGELDGASEKQVVSEIVTALRLQGYRTPREWKPGTRGIYIRVGQLKAKGSGTDEGAPDLIVVKLGWAGVDADYPRRFFFEVKARTKAARLSKEQNTLEQLGVIYVVNSASATLALLERQ